jgi:hypothetical protein
MPDEDEGECTELLYDRELDGGVCAGVPLVVEETALRGEGICAAETP